MNVDTLDPAAEPPLIDAPSDADAARDERASGRPGAWAAAATLAGVAIVAVRWWAARDRREYSLWPDEPAQLAIARFVGGGTHWTMRNHSIWRPGYGTLLGPVYALTDDPQHVFRAAMALNAVLGGVAAALLVLLARRLTGLGPLGAGLCAVAVAATPALLFPTGFVWSESLIAPLYLGTVLALLAFWEAPGIRRGLVVAALCGAGFATHSRLLPLALVTVLLVGMALERRRVRVGDAAVVLAGLGVALLAASRYSAFVTGRLWDNPSERNSVGGVVDQFADPAAIGVSALGQAWYLLVGSLGLLGVAAVELVRRRGGAYGVVGLAVTAQVALSVVFMADRWRPDQLVYGRYNDVVVAPLLLIGLACLAGRARSVWTPSQLAVTIAGTGAAALLGGWALWHLRADELRESNGLEPMILAIQPFVDGRATIPVVRITLLALCAAAALAAAAVSRRRWLIGGVVALLLVSGAMRTEDVLNRGWNGSGGLSRVAELASPGSPLADGAPVDYYLRASSNSTGRLMLYQWYLPGSDFTVVAQPLAQASSPYVFADLDTPDLVDGGAELVWRDPIKAVGLWLRPAAYAPSS